MKKYLIWFLIFLGLAAAVIGIVYYLGSESQNEEMTNELQIIDLVVGAGKEAVAGNRVTVHYVGAFLDGTKFDSSIDRNESFVFNLGAGDVIQGWDEGVAGMKEGGKRKLVIPPDLAYGAGGSGPIPPNSTLQFEVTLLKVE